MLKRILIVDDEPAIRDMVAFALRRGEYEPVHAGDALQAQSAIAERVPDLILLDWMLPGTSGLELARRWRPELHAAFKKHQKHTALADVEESIQELVYYRDTFLRLEAATPVQEGAA